jgi:hypothetical protein
LSAFLVFVTLCRMLVKLISSKSVMLGRKVLPFLVIVGVSAGTVCAAPIVVNSLEVWDGGTVHGIAPTGSGTSGDPYVYAIGEGIVLTSSGVVETGDKYVTFDFSSGPAGLDMESGGYFDLTGGNRLYDPGQITIVLGGSSITGMGDFKTIDISKDSKSVYITGAGDVHTDSLHLRTQDAYSGDVSVDVGGSINIGSIDTQDVSTGGNDGGNVTVVSYDIVVGDIDTRSLRTASNTGSSGHVVVEARDYDGSNSISNSVTLFGLIDTDSAAGADGDITVSGVVVRLESGFDAVTGGGSMDIFAGVIRPGMNAGDLFIDNSGGDYSATHNVAWDDSLGLELPESGGLEAVSPALINVILAPPQSQTVTVDYDTGGYSAIEGTDFVSTAGTLVFDPYQTSKTISVDIIDDDQAEDDETFWVRLDNLVGQGVELTRDLHTYTISDIRYTPFSNPGMGDFGDGKAAWGDYNNDGWVDLLASGKLWRNNSGSSFTQVANISSGVFGDYDNDGYLDIYSYTSRKLFGNSEGTGFVEQPLPTLPVSISCGASWGDFDNDGYLDIYVGGYETWEMPSYPDFILVNNRDGTFYVGWVQSDISGYRNRARGVTSCDWDQDDDIDVYVSNYRIYPNILWRNDGSGTFNNVAPTHNAQAGAGHSIGAAWGDFDNDGLFDLFAGNFAHPWGGQPESRFLRNRGESAEFQFEDMGTCGVYYQESYASPAAGDYDNDGDLDLYFTTVYATASYGIKNYPALFRNDANCNFTPVTDTEGLGQLGPTYQAAFADFDNDGDLDLITDGRLFVNNGTSNNWLKLRLEGDGQSVNRAAIGAQVRIETGGQTLIRQVESGTGEGNQNGLVLHFGLGDESGPVDVHIDWPDGTEQTVSNLPVNQTINILGPDGPAPVIEVSPAGLEFSADSGGPDPGPQSLYIRNGGTGTLSWEITEGCSWLNVTPTSGQSTGQTNEVTVSVDISGLAAGPYYCQLTLSDPCAINSPQTVSVSLTIQGPVLELSGSQFVFRAEPNGPNSSGQMLTIRNAGAGLLCWQISEDCDWLRAEPNIGSSMGQADDVNVSVDVSGLESGAYDCVLTVSDANAQNSPQGVAVTLHLFPPEELLVPLHYPTIQAAVDAAEDGDIVIVTDGTYTGAGNRDIDLGGKAITVRSENGPANCIIDCEGSTAEPHRGFYFHSSEDALSVVEGFTITGGHADYGGGMYNDQSSPTVRNCVFLENSADVYGGGVENWDSSVTLVNCVFTGNHALDAGGVDNAYGSPRLTNCTFSQNTAAVSSGGIYCFASSTMIENCILWGNAPDQLYTQIITPAVTYCDVEGGFSGDGNIDVDPVFVDAASGDYHLLPGSPAIDAGDPASDWVNEPWPNGGRVNMGAYGNTSEATRSPAGYDDLATLVLYWLSDEPSVDIAPAPAGDGIANFLDFAALAYYWPWEP